MLRMIQNVTIAAMFMWTADPRPELPYFDWNACPFEGCAYKQWTAKEAIPVYDTWNGSRRKVVSLKAGDKVTGVTGVVITYRPRRIRIDKDRPEEKLKRGDVVWTYTYQGEGTFKAWFNGAFHDYFDATFVCSADQPARSDCAGAVLEDGKHAWWGKIRLKSGRTGWVDMGKSMFDGVDLLG
jgi:hypothetical protein